jgi:hypothetical protein
MRGEYLRRFAGFLLVALLFPGVITLVSSTTVQAQRRVVIVRTYRPFYRPFYYRDPFWDPYWGFNRSNYYGEYVFSSSERAENQGYQDGLKTGQSDVEHRRSYNPERSHYFHDAGFGNYASAYRVGFARGYSDGFRS